jgi:spermidine synthase
MSLAGAAGKSGEGFSISGRASVGLPLALAALSGAAGLAHQLLWVRRMIDILGADAGTFSRVIGAFFLGLALGAWIAANIRTARPWLAVAFAELAVAGLAFFVLLAGQWGDFGQGHPAWARWLGWVLPLLLIVPPAFAMGMVIPWMIRACGAAYAVPLYAVNTLGGIGGLALTLAWALPSLGLAGASVTALCLNLLVAAGAAWLGKAGAAEAGEATRGGSIGNWPIAALGFASGFLVLGAEIFFQHQLAQMLISSYFSSALVLTLVLLALGLSAFAVPLFAQLGDKALPIALCASAVAFAVQPVLLILQRSGISYVPFEKHFPEYVLSALALGVPAVALVLLPAGLIFPLLLRQAATAGVDAGRLLAVNGIGGWLGAEIATRYLLPMFGIWYGMALIALGYAACLLACKGRLRWLFIPALGLVVAWTWKLDAKLPYVSVIKGDNVSQVAIGREGVVSVVTGGPEDLRIVFNNSYTLGGTRARVNQERQVLLPMLLHGDAKRVATLGIATGSTLSGATMEPVLEQVEGIELSPLVLHFASSVFAPYNRDIANNPLVKLTHGDARWVVGQRPGAYDVIEGDLFLPWGTGEGRLFTREHFEKVRGALKPGGLYCQWMPMYQITRPQFEVIARTFREVFPDAWIVRGDFYTSMPIIGLVGGRSVSSLDWEKIEAACERLRAADICRDPLLRRAAGVATFVVGPVLDPGPGPINTLANSWLEWNAARNVIGLREPWFVGVPLATYLRDIQRAHADELPGKFRAAQRAGELLNTLEIARATKIPQAEEIEAALKEVFPVDIEFDPHADWKSFPMRYPPGFIKP